MSNEKSFWAHLDDLRGVLLRSVVVYIVACVALFAFIPRIFNDVVLAPSRGDFFVYRLLDRVAATMPGFADPSVSSGGDISLINIELASQFFIHMTATCWLALLITLPVIVYFLWTFVRPGLYPEERRHSRLAFLAGHAMFYLGAATAYFLVFPLTLRFLAGYQLSPDIPNVISLTSYMDTFVTLLLLMGLVFELPLLAWVLGKTGLLTRGFFTRYRRHAIVALVAVAAIITPTGDPLTLFVVFIPVYILWELSAYLVPLDRPEENEEE